MISRPGIERLHYQRRIHWIDEQSRRSAACFSGWRQLSYSQGEAIKLTRSPFQDFYFSPFDTYFCSLMTSILVCPLATTQFIYHPNNRWITEWIISIDTLSGTSCYRMFLWNRSEWERCAGRSVPRRSVPLRLRTHGPPGTDRNRWEVPTWKSNSVAIRYIILLIMYE